MYPIYHDLVWIPPLHASGIVATLGLNIQNNSANFFANKAQPGGILIAPKGITQAQADEMKTRWQAAFSGENRGNVAVLGGELAYHQITENASNSQVIEQWDAASKAIAAVFHVPWSLVGGDVPAYGNIQSETVRYFTQCIQSLAVAIETVLDKGLALPKPYGTEFNISDLLWMDTATQMAVLKEGVGGAIFTTNEARRQLNLPPVTGGDDVLSQQQNWSLAALSRRDEMALAPASTPTTLPQGTEQAAPTDDEDEDDGVERFMTTLHAKAMSSGLFASDDAPLVLHAQQAHRATRKRIRYEPIDGHMRPVEIIQDEG
jgi:phage portal protein BeeE